MSIRTTEKYKFSYQVFRK